MIPKILKSNVQTSEPENAPPQYSIGNEDLNPELEAYLDFFVEIASIGS